MVNPRDHIASRLAANFFHDEVRKPVMHPRLPRHLRQAYVSLLGPKLPGLGPRLGGGRPGIGLRGLPGISSIPGAACLYSIEFIKLPAPQPVKGGKSVVAEERPDSNKCGNQIDLIVAIRCKRMPAEACLYIPYINLSPRQVQRVASC